MDAFADLFRGVRARGSLFGRSVLSPPWALRFIDGAPLTLCIVLDGAGWIVRQGERAHLVAAGQSVIVRGPEPFSFVDDLDSNAVPIECGEFCSVPEYGGASHRLGWNDCGNPDGATTLIVGAYPVSGDIGERLLETLPSLLRVVSGGAAGSALGFISSEVAADRPGQQVVLDRLLDWMLVCALRDWFDRPESQPPAWYSALRDPVVGHALRLLHENPAHPWTISELADSAGVSRSTMAKRFRDQVGEPPLTYLTRWRMTLAADLLFEREAATVAEIARSTGYADAFSFSSAFKRIKGISPTMHRRTRSPDGSAEGTARTSYPST